ncbi:hypothetical protein [Flavobacterium sp. WC2509]|uniref:hypothetical protein n=1 Tax=Flavobacterium sp. WC2509 TaxID=3461406 RepID=UPI004044ABF9
MKNLYLKAGKAQDVFNDLKDNFNGTLTYNNDQYNLALDSKLAKGNINGIVFPDGMTYMQFDVIFYDDVRLSMEPFMNFPILFAYCKEGILKHSFGEHGERKMIKKQQTGILKSTSSLNSILHFEKRIPVKFHAIVINTVADNEFNGQLVKKLKKTFLDVKGDYLDISFQNFKIAQKIEELNMLLHKGIVRNLLINRILDKIIEIEIEQHTDGFTLMAQAISSFTIKQIDEIKRVSDVVINLSLELFTTDYLIQKAKLSVYKLQKEFKILLNRTVHEFLIYVRIERERV